MKHSNIDSCHLSKVSEVPAYKEEDDDKDIIPKNYVRPNVKSILKNSHMKTVQGGSTLNSSDV